MKKVFILFLLTSCHLYGADSTAVKIFKRWSIGLSFSPDYSYRVIKPIQSDIYMAHNNGLVDQMNLTEKATISYSIGIPVTYKFNKSFGFKTCIYLSNKTFKSKGFVYKDFLYSDEIIFDSDQWTKSNFFFMEIPFAFELTLQPSNFKKLSYKIFAGATICSNIKEHTYASRRWLPGGSLGPNNSALESSYVKFGVNKFSLLYIGYTAGFNATYKLNEKLNIAVEPVFKFYGNGYTAIPKNKFGGGYPLFYGVYEMPYSIGCNISVSYLF
ncbi:MAG: hypothetical protein K8R85_17085 [Bacteroidetes bacterium]|nr:hypothetical protein [Bacteroidota bacterium]